MGLERLNVASDAWHAYHLADTVVEAALEAYPTLNDGKDRLIALLWILRNQVETVAKALDDSTPGLGAGR